MVNWREYTITENEIIETSANRTSPSYVRFGLSDYVNYFGTYSREKFIWCENTYPFNSYRKGDIIEIDLDKTQHIRSTYLEEIVKSTEDVVKLVRKVGSSAVVSSSSGGLTISTTPSSAAEVAGVVTQTMMDQAERTGADVQCQIEQNTGNVNLFYRPKK